MRTIAMINQKGGVGKTTTVANLGAALAAKGREVCLIDLDPQAHLTLHLAARPASHPTSVYDVLVSDAPLSAATLKIADRLWLVPSVIDLAAAEIELVSTVGRERILRDRLRQPPRPCEFVLIDCPPSLGLLTLNALAAAQEVFIPLQPHFLALQGLGKLLETVALVQRRINPDLRVSGVMLCMYESATRLAGEVVADLRNFFDAARGTDVPWADTRIFNTVVRRNIKLAECPSHGQTIFDYEPNSNGARDYLALAEEFLACRAQAAPPAAEAATPPSRERPDGQSTAAQPPPPGEQNRPSEAAPAQAPGEKRNETQGHPAPPDSERGAEQPHAASEPGSFADRHPPAAAPPDRARQGP